MPRLQTKMAAFDSSEISLGDALVSRDANSVKVAVESPASNAGDGPKKRKKPWLVANLSSQGAATSGPAPS